MAAVAKNFSPSYSSVLIPANDKITGLYCGENLRAGDACYVKAADGLIYRSSGAATGAAAHISGYAATDAYVAQNDAITLIREATWGYGSGLTPGPVYLSGSVAGGLDTAPSTGGTVPCGEIIDSARIILWPTRTI